MVLCPVNWSSRCQNYSLALSTWSWTVDTLWDQENNLHTITNQIYSLQSNIKRFNFKIFYYRTTWNYHEYANWQVSIILADIYLGRKVLKAGLVTSSSGGVFYKHRPSTFELQRWQKWPRLAELTVRGKWLTFLSDTMFKMSQTTDTYQHFNSHTLLTSFMYA